MISNPAPFSKVNLTYEATAKQIQDQSKGPIVFTNGCFDLLHMGHIGTLAFAKNQVGPNGSLVVGLNSDASVRRLKGSGRPIMKELDRALMLMAIRYVDHVVIFSEDDPLLLIQALRPDLIVKGGDYVPESVVGASVAKVIVSPYDKRYSTTGLIERLQDER